MTYTFEIKETKESLPLIAHLKTLKYVKAHKTNDISAEERQMAKAVKVAEKGKSIAWAEFKQDAKTWKTKLTK